MVKTKISDFSYWASSTPGAFEAQIREQMSGPEIFLYGKSILGCGLWPGLVSGKKGSGPIMSNF